MSTGPFISSGPGRPGPPGPPAGPVSAPVRVPASAPAVQAPAWALVPVPGLTRVPVRVGLLAGGGPPRAPGRAAPSAAGVPLEAAAGPAAPLAGDVPAGAAAPAAEAEDKTDGIQKGRQVFTPMSLS